MLAITDFSKDRHHYHQDFSLFGGSVDVEGNKVKMNDSYLIRKSNGLLMEGVTEEFAFRLETEFKKEGILQCGSGKLQMGTSDPKDETYYYSYTNMPTSGEIFVDGKKLSVTGNTWFDKQGGPFHIFEPDTHWEWFSLRFYDDEEAMLFSFPRNVEFQNGTYIKENGEALQWKDYTLNPTSFIETDGMKFSNGWELDCPGLKEGWYRIEPIFSGQLNLGYYEKLCKIYDIHNNEAGFAIVELLPGVYNKNQISPLGLLKKH